MVAKSRKIGVQRSPPTLSTGAGPINTHRGIVFATEIGESQGKTKYLMRAPVGLALGALYADYDTPEGPYRSMAIITRPAHSRFAVYHEKAQPLFLPFDADTIKTWLDPEIPAKDERIRELLDNPTITADLEVTPVKVFKNADAVGPTENLTKE